MTTSDILALLLSRSQSPMGMLRLNTSANLSSTVHFWHDEKYSWTVFTDSVSGHASKISKSVQIPNIHLIQPSPHVKPIPVK